MVGIVGDGDGWELVNGHWRHVGPGPDDPWRRVWDGPSANQRDLLWGMGIQELASLVHSSSVRTELSIAWEGNSSNHTRLPLLISGLPGLSDALANLAPLAARKRFGKFGLRKF